MEEKNIVKNKEENIKILIASIINNQIGKKLKYLELKNDSDKKEINQLSITSKELIKNLDSFTYKINKKFIEQKYQRKMINNKINIRRFSPSNNLIKKGKFKKYVTNYDIDNNNNIKKDNNNLKKNLLYKRSQTPLKALNAIMKKNIAKCKRDLLVHSKSIDTTRKSKNKYFNKLDNLNKNQFFNNRKRYKTPVRKKNKNYYNKLNKTADNSLNKKPTIEFDLTSLDNDIEITKISINYDETKDRISNVLSNTNKTRLTIKLGPFQEKIENEKLLTEDEDVFLENINHEPFKKVIETIFENLFSFLDIKSFFNIMTVNKQYFHLIIKLLINKLENKIKNINQNLKELKSNNKSLNLKDEKIKLFEYNNSSLRALSILNSITKENFFTEKKINFEDKKIKIIFDLYFITIGKKKDVITLNFKNELREKYTMNYFKNSNHKNFGNIIDYDLKQLKFNDEIINSLFECSYGKLNFIAPKNFQRINKNITWFCYLIKNILEFLGILNKDNKNIKQLYNLFCSRLHINNELIRKLKKIQDLY